MSSRLLNLFSSTSSKRYINTSGNTEASEGPTSSKTQQNKSNSPNNSDKSPGEYGKKSPRATAEELESKAIWKGVLDRLKIRDPTLKEIKLSNLVRISRNDFYMLAILLKNNPFVRTIELTNVGLTDIDCSVLCPSFYTCRNLKHLSLEGNQIDRGIDAISSMIATHPSLRSLNILNQNNYTPMNPNCEQKFIQAVIYNGSLLRIDYHCTSFEVTESVHYCLQRNQLMYDQKEEQKLK